MRLMCPFSAVRIRVILNTKAQSVEVIDNGNEKFSSFEQFLNAKYGYDRISQIEFLDGQAESVQLGSESSAIPSEQHEKSLLILQNYNNLCYYRASLWSKNVDDGVREWGESLSGCAPLKDVMLNRVLRLQAQTISRYTYWWRPIHAQVVWEIIIELLTHTE